MKGRVTCIISRTGSGAWNFRVRTLADASLSVGECPNVPTTKTRRGISTTRKELA